MNMKKDSDENEQDGNVVVGNDNANSMCVTNHILGRLCRYEWAFVSNDFFFILFSFYRLGSQSIPFDQTEGEGNASIHQTRFVRRMRDNQQFRNIYNRILRPHCISDPYIDPTCLYLCILCI